MSHTRRTTVVAADQRSDWPKFAYESVPDSVATFLRGEGERIRRRYTISIIEIGKGLLRAKHYLSHGSFIAWVEAEVGMPARTAQAYMRIAQWGSDKSASVAHLPPAVLYVLSASSTPRAFVNKISTRAEAGEKIVLADVRRELQEYRQTEAYRPQQKELAASRSTAIASNPDVNASLEQAVKIIARKLSAADFRQVKSIFTDQSLTEDPRFGDLVVTVFSKTGISNVGKGVSGGHRSIIALWPATQERPRLSTAG